MKPRTHRTKGDAEHGGDLFVRQAVAKPESKGLAKVVRQTRGCVSHCVEFRVIRFNRRRYLLRERLCALPPTNRGGSQIPRDGE